MSRVKSLTRSSRGGQRALSELGAELMERRASQGGEGKALDLLLRSDYPCPTMGLQLDHRAGTSENRGSYSPHVLYHVGGSHGLEMGAELA